MSSKLLVIGCGSIGSRHAANACGLCSVHVFDEDSVKVDDLVTSLNVTGHYDLLSALTANPDAIIVATPTHVHAETVAKCLESSKKILVEKPIARTVSEANRMVKQLGCSNFADVCVSSNMRFHPGPKILKNEISSIGKIYSFRGWFGSYLPSMRHGIDYRKLYCSKKSEGGGVVRDSIHDIDLALWLLGPPSFTTGIACKVSRLEIDVEDVAEIVMKHRSNVISNIHLDYLQKRKRRGIEIIGSKGTLTWTSEGKNPEKVNVCRTLGEHGSVEILFSDICFDGNQPYKEMLDKFLSSDELDKTEISSVTEAILALDCCEKVISHEQVFE